MKPGAALQTPPSLINSLSQSSFVKISLWRHHALMVKDDAFSHKIDYVSFLYEILNHEGHLNRFIGLKVTAILGNGGILPVKLHREGSATAACAEGLFLFILTYDFVF